MLGIASLAGQLHTRFRHNAGSLAGIGPLSLIRSSMNASSPKATEHTPLMRQYGRRVV